MSTPVTFDHFAPEMGGPEFWDALEELRAHGPLCWVDSYGGYWAATSYQLVLDLAQDWKTFSSAQGISITRPPEDKMPYILPIEHDPPRQRVYRQQLNPHLTFKALMDLEEPIRAVTADAIDAFAADGCCDIVAAFTRRLPGTVLFRLLFQCSDEDFRHVEPWSKVISFSPDPDLIAQASRELTAWAERMLAARGPAAGGPAAGGPAARPDGNRTHDLVGAILGLGQAGIEMADSEYPSALQILIQGGIGTAANATGTIIRVLCENPDLQQRVRDDRSLLPPLIEECLRLESPTVLIFRTATRDIEVAGQQIRRGDKVGLFFGAANRDPAVFDHPDQIDLERPHNRHLAFGGGPHRCIGSNLARMEIRVFIDELLTRMGPFRIPEGAMLSYANGQTRGLSSMPLEFEPRVGVP